MNANDCLSLDPLGPVEGGNGIVEGSHVADVCPQTTIPHPLGDLTQLGAIRSTTKSIVRPPEGRASVGPVTVAGVPPKRSFTGSSRFCLHLCIPSKHMAER